MDWVKAWTWRQRSSSLASLWYGAWGGVGRTIGGRRTRTRAVHVHLDSLSPQSNSKSKLQPVSPRVQPGQPSQHGRQYVLMTQSLCRFSSLAPYAAATDLANRARLGVPHLYLSKRITGTRWVFACATVAEEPSLKLIYVFLLPLLKRRNDSTRGTRGESLVHSAVSLRKVNHSPLGVVTVPADVDVGYFACDVLCDEHHPQAYCTSDLCMQKPFAFTLAQ